MHKIICRFWDLISCLGTGYTNKIMYGFPGLMRKSDILKFILYFSKPNVW